MLRLDRPRKLTLSQSTAKGDRGVTKANGPTGISVQSGSFSRILRKSMISQLLFILACQRSGPVRSLDCCRISGALLIYRRWQTRFRVTESEMTKETARYILITGAVGTSTTTLADALAKELSTTHLEADDFLWLPSYPSASGGQNAARRARATKNALSWPCCGCWISNGLGSTA